MVVRNKGHANMDFHLLYTTTLVIPCHPAIALLWGAHVNLQRICNEAWSYYVLKYAIKSEPFGKLNLNPDAARCLGLKGMTDAELRVTSALYMSKPVSPAEAALVLLNIPIVHMSSSVEYLD
eukprot:jgi/Chlat1/6149/Chrsp41S05722